MIDESCIVLAFLIHIKRFYVKLENVRKKEMEISTIFFY